MTTTKEETELHIRRLLQGGDIGYLSREGAAVHLRALQRELDETRNLLSAERAAHASTRGVADAAVRGQMRAEDRLEKLLKVLASITTALGPVL